MCTVSAAFGNGAGNSKLYEKPCRKYTTLTFTTMTCCRLIFFCNICIMNHHILKLWTKEQKYKQLVSRMCSREGLCLVSVTVWWNIAQSLYYTIHCILISITSDSQSGLKHRTADATRGRNARTETTNDVGESAVRKSLIYARISEWRYLFYKSSYSEFKDWGTMQLVGKMQQQRKQIVEDTLLRRGCCRITVLWMHCIVKCHIL